MVRALLHFGLCLTLWGGLEAHASASPQGDAAGDRVEQARLAALIDRLVRRGDEDAVSYVLAAYERGMPPEALLAFVVAARETPHAAYREPLLRLSRHRNSSLRAHALVTLSVHGAELAELATLRALEDHELTLRFLGVELARRHSTPRTEEAVIELVARDASVATYVGE